MSDINREELTEVSTIALWKRYCHKKSECENLTKETAQLKADKAELILEMNKIYVMMHEFYDEHDFDGSTCDLAMHELLQKHKEPNNA